MHFNKAMLLWGQPKRHIHREVVQRPTLKRHDANTPTEVTLRLQPAYISLFLRPKHENNPWHIVRAITILDLFSDIFYLCAKNLE